jgi:CRISPR-associated endonuclease Csn1
MKGERKGELIIGLDLGMNNVGWSLTEQADDHLEILGMGTLVFSSPLIDLNKPEEGYKSKQRGQHRRQRRTLQHRSTRRKHLYRLLARLGMMPLDPEARAHFLCRNKDGHVRVDPFTLRAKAVEQPVSKTELGRALCHLNQRRGFLSPRDLMLLGIAKFDPEDLEEEPHETEPGKDEEDTGLILSEIKRTKAEVGSRTLGQFLLERVQAGEPVRKKKFSDQKNLPDGTSVKNRINAKRHSELYWVRADRHMVEAEFNRIIATQRPHHPELTDDVVQQMHRIIFHQESMQEAGIRGHCTLRPDKPRALRASIHGQRFGLLNDLVNLDIAEGPAEPLRRLRPAEVEILLEALMNGEDLTWAEAKRHIGLDDHARFSVEPAPGTKRGKKTQPGTKEKLRGSQTIARVRQVLGEKWEQMHPEGRHKLIHEITSLRQPAGKAKTHDFLPHGIKPAHHRLNLFRRQEYGGVRFTEDEAKRLATLKLPDGTMSVSSLAIRELTYVMLGRDQARDEVLRMFEAIPIAYERDHSPRPQQNLDWDELRKDALEIGHPLVRCAVINALRVLKALVEEHGVPDRIHVEMLRDLAKSAARREEDSRRQAVNEKERRTLVAELMTHRIPPTEGNIRKLRLAYESDWQLPYEPGRRIQDIRDLFEGGYDIDHIVPRSHGFDDSFGNLVLCSNNVNAQVKGDRTPYEVFGKNAEEWQQITAHVKAIKSMPLRKRERILQKTRPEGFLERDKATSGYIAREVLALCQKIVARPEDVVPVPGRLTAELRRRWELEGLIPLHPEEEAQLAPKREIRAMPENSEALETQDPQVISKAVKLRSNYLHHALDALVIALSTRSNYQALQAYFKLKEENSYRSLTQSERKEQKLQPPVSDLRALVAAALEQAVVVHRPNRRVSGGLHDQMAKRDRLPAQRTGEPGTAELVIEKKALVRYDETGRAAQAFPLGDNHHMVIWESVTPDKNGTYPREVEVVSLLEAQLRKARERPVIVRHRPGFRFVMALCKRDMVEMEDGTIVVMSMASAISPYKPYVLLWHPYVAAQLGKRNKDNPYLYQLVQTTSFLQKFRYRVILDLFGRVIFREGRDE